MARFHKTANPEKMPDWWSTVPGLTVDYQTGDCYGPVDALEVIGEDVSDIVQNITYDPLPPYPGIREYQREGARWILAVARLRRAFARR